jgi:hypothetical protein
MILTTLSQRRFLTLHVLLPAITVFLLTYPVSAEPEGKSDASITNIRWTSKKDVITINYDLNGTADQKYSVDIAMKKDNDSTFFIIPTTVDGDVGSEVAAGTNREIHWYYQHDYPKGFAGPGYYFEIHVKLVEQQSNLLYYIVGAAALSGGVVALLIGKGQNSTFRSNLDLPMPPGRP